VPRYRKPYGMSEKGTLCTSRGLQAQRTGRMRRGKLNRGPRCNPCGGDGVNALRVVATWRRPNGKMKEKETVVYQVCRVCRGNGEVLQ